MPTGGKRLQNWSFHQPSGIITSRHCLLGPKDRRAICQRDGIGRRIATAIPATGAGSIPCRWHRQLPPALADMPVPVQSDIMSANKAVGIATVVMVLCIWVYIALSGEARLPTGIANGRYSNDCCGTIVLDDGVMTVANQRVDYIIERDKTGAYVLPMAYVGASSHAFVVRSDAHPLKLRLDDLAHPRQLQLVSDAADGGGYSFARVNGS